jgi:hypothetical protein
MAWTSTTPVAEAGVGERGAWPCSGVGAHADTRAASKRHVFRQQAFIFNRFGRVTMNET